MSKRNFVCFKCRAAVRRAPYSGEAVLCPSCGEECRNIGYKIPVPPKSKPEAWRQLQEQYFGERRKIIEDAAALNVRGVHNLEKEIAKLEARPGNEGRAREIRHLRRRLESLK